MLSKNGFAARHSSIFFPYARDDEDLQLNSTEFLDVFGTIGEGKGNSSHGRFSDEHSKDFSSPTVRGKDVLIS